ncbi:NUDIX domain-containing protein [Pseudomonas sp. S37]|uniref:NUDIX domain-containing protein n=1 Tax=Pseudomonas sp. S37 TaxID=2767449 RepID=UPI0019137B7D|nr:NUDIX domain-containing protein [Pseudomonas sp. S37]
MNDMRERHSTVICMQEGKILLVRKEAPEWSLPGGKIDPGENHLEAAQRELSEETTLPLTDARFLAHHVFETEEHYLYQMSVSDSLQPRPSDEIVECRWFKVDELATANVKPTNIELLILAGLL